jgi:D-alanyl-lipoteichoic acid acyltransferase DltB (MBOAT superfamily)
MPFNSLNFLYFFLIFYALYLALQKNHRLQNIWLLSASYAFYAFWDWRFLFVLLAVTAVSYLTGLGLSSLGVRELAKPYLRRLLLGVGILFNLGTLIFFKYAEFFTGGLQRIFDRLNLPLDPLLVNIILPVGLSFYALQACSYLWDVAARRIQPARNVFEFALFIAFFPQLLAGPIERAGRMLPQFHQARRLTPATVSSGIYLLFSGFFKKLVIADNLGLIVTTVFDSYTSYQGLDLLIALLAFSLQLYADFSAYSDIARGLARLLGFELMVNFRLPYFSASPAEFWSRWHISLSEWLRDYIFFPMRRSFLRWKHPLAKLVGLLFPPLVTMLVSGLWHGTGWNFVIWGLYHGLLLILYQVLVKERPHGSGKHSQAGEIPAWRKALSWFRPRLDLAARILSMFTLTSFGWLIFRVESREQFFYFITHLSLQATAQSAITWANLVLYSLPLVVVQITQQARNDLLVLMRLPLVLRVLLYAVALTLIVILGARQASEFIYVQF